MTDRPENTAEWATDGTNVLEPTETKRAAGWLPGEAPPAQFFNWWKNLVGTWIKYLDEQIAAIDVPDVSHFASLDVANSFSAPQAVIFNQADQAVLSTYKWAPNDSHADNTWKLIFEFRAGGGTISWRLYTGRFSNAAAVVANAIWSTADAHWQQDDATLGSVALIWMFGKLRVSGVDAGASPWELWPTDRGDFDIGGDLEVAGDFSAGNISTGGNVVASGDVSAVNLAASGDATIQGDVAAAGDFNYAALRATETELVLADGVSSHPEVTYFEQEWLAGPSTPAGGYATVAVALDLPVGAVLYGIDAKHQQPSTASLFRLNVHHSDWSTSGDPSADLTSFASDTITAGSGWGQDKIEASLSGGLTIEANKAYVLIWQPGLSARFARGRLRWGNPGPR